MIGPTPLPTKAREAAPWGLRIGVTLIVLLVVLVIVGPVLWSVDPTYESIEGLSPLGEPLDAGAEGYPLGSDPKGRDLLARLLYAGRLTLLTALVSVGIATAAGLLVGLVAANTRRFAGSVLMRFTDLGLAIPGLLLAAAIATILGRGTLSLVVGLAAMHAGWFPAFATALIFLIVGMLLGFPDLPLAVLVGFTAATGPDISTFTFAVASLRARNVRPSPSTM